MMRLSLPKQDSCPNFIGSWAIEPKSVCDEIITYFESNKSKQKQGQTISGKDLETKNTIDLVMSPKEIVLPENECFNTYFSTLFQCYSDYTMQWPFLKEFAE